MYRLGIRLPERQALRDDVVLYVTFFMNGVWNSEVGLCSLNWRPADFVGRMRVLEPRPLLSLSKPISMRLSLDQQQAVANHLNTRGQAPKCTVCGASNLQVRAEITRLPVEGETDAFPMINVQCAYCGHLLHFSPSVMDLDLDASPASPSAEDAES